MSNYGFPRDEEYPPPSRPIAGPYTAEQQRRYPDPHATGFIPYSGPYAQPYDDGQGYGVQQPYPIERPTGQGYPPVPYRMPGRLPAPPDVPQVHPQAGTVLALGLLGLIVPVVSFVAWYLGSRTEREIEESGLDYVNTGTIAAGRILGMVVSIVQIVVFGLILTELVLGVAAFTVSP